MTVVMHTRPCTVWLPAERGKKKKAEIFKEQTAWRGGSGSFNMAFLVIKTKKGKLKAAIWKWMKGDAS